MSEVIEILIQSTPDKVLQTIAQKVFDQKRITDEECLALFERGRERQLDEIIRYIDTLADGGPTIVAGDFNDWRNRVSAPMQAAGFNEVFEVLTGSPAKTFPSVKPMLPMDRIYVRGLKIHSAEVLYEWLKLSDHLGITAELEIE